MKITDTTPIATIVIGYDGTVTPTMVVVDDEDTLAGHGGTLLAILLAFLKSDNPRIVAVRNTVTGIVQAEMDAIEGRK